MDEMRFQWRVEAWVDVLQLEGRPLQAKGKIQRGRRDKQGSGCIEVLRYLKRSKCDYSMGSDVVEMALR